MELSGNIALVTGAAHRVGKAIALALGRAGAHVVAHYGGSAEAAARTAEEIRQLGVEAWTVQADLADPAAIAALFTEADSQAGGLDLLVNSAATFQKTPFDRISATEWDAVQAVNLRAPFLCSQQAAPRIRRGAQRRGGAAGAIINIVDLAGLYPWRGYAHHGVSKAGLVHLTKVSAAELGPQVRVNAIAPGAVLPPPGVAAHSSDWQAIGQHLPVGRTGDPARVGEAVVFLATNDFITGEILRVDGGEHLFAGSRR